MGISNLMPRNNGKILPPEIAAGLVELADEKEEPVSEDLTAKLDINSANSSNFGYDHVLKIIALQLNKDNYSFFTGSKKHPSSYDVVIMNADTVSINQVVSIFNKGYKVKWNLYFLPKKYLNIMFIKGGLLAIYDHDFEKTRKFLINKYNSPGINLEIDTLDPKTGRGIFKVYERDKMITDMFNYTFPKALAYFYTRYILMKDDISEFACESKSFEVTKFEGKP